jgi:hypothetical protein
MNNQAFSKIWILIILIILIGGGILTYQYLLAPKEEIETPEEGTTEEEIADWQTYRNDKYSYEFKYPAELKVESFLDSGTVPINEVSAVGIGLSVPVQPVSSEEFAEMSRNVIIIHVTDDFQDLAINQFSDYSNGEMICKTKKEKETTELICKIDNFVIIMDSVFEKDDVFYEVLFNTILERDRTYWDFSENIDIYKKVLSTFRFLE